MTKINVQLKVLNDQIYEDMDNNKIDIIPKYSTDGSAGIDFYAAIDKPCIIFPGKIEFIPTGVAVWIKDPEYALLILPRSGLGCKHRIVPGNSPGLVDSDYQGQVFVCLENKGKANFEILPGDKIAQGVLIPVVRMDFDVVDEFHKETERNTGGFGSTGR